MLSNIIYSHFKDEWINRYDILSNSKLVSHKDIAYVLPLGDYWMVHNDRELLYERELIKGNIHWSIYTKGIDKLIYFAIYFTIRPLV